LKHFFSSSCYLDSSSGFSASLYLILCNLGFGYHHSLPRLFLQFPDQCLCISLDLQPFMFQPV
jgi:hypothetical protein